MKRHAAPTFWPLMRKEFKWAVKPSPGPHPINRSLPLLVVVRDLLKYVERAKEARRLIAEGHFKIDGIVRTDYKFPVGLMDVIEVVDTGEFFRVIPAPITYMTLIPIERSEGSFKLCRIEDKTTLKGGKVQLNLHDGKNVEVSNEEAKKLTTMSVLKVSIPDYRLLGYIPIEKGVLATIVGGMNVGRVGRVLSVSEGMRHYRKLVLLEDVTGGSFYTSLDKVFVVGIEKPEIALPATVKSGVMR